MLLALDSARSFTKSVEQRGRMAVRVEVRNALRKNPTWKRRMEGAERIQDRGLANSFTQKLISSGLLFFIIRTSCSFSRSGEFARFTFHYFIHYFHFICLETLIYNYCCSSLYLKLASINLLFPVL